MDKMEGRFAQILPPKVADDQMRLLAKSHVESQRHQRRQARRGCPSSTFSALNLFLLGQLMSNLLCHAVGMKIKKSVRFQVSNFSFFHGVTRHLIAAFGTARLFRKSNGRHELIGGTADDRVAAREWCSLFAHEVVFSSTPRCHSLVAFAE
jgi:hypothetical protein